MSIHPFRAALGVACLFPSIASAQITFSGPTNHALLGVRPDGVAVGDFDGANGRDFAVTSGSPSGTNGPDFVEVFSNQGGGVFAHAETVLLGNNQGAAEIVAADLDLDGDLDLAVAQHNTSSVRILLNQGGTFVLGGVTSSGGGETRHIAAADLDGDGDVDLAASNRSSNNVSLLRNDGAGTFTPMGLVSTGLEPYDLALDDLNGDCRTDIAVAAHDARAVNVMFNLGAGTFGAAVAIPVPGNQKPAGMVAADLDGDGDVDLASTTDNNGIGLLVVLRNAGTGTFTAENVLTNGSNPGAIAAGDFDGDGDQDLATADENSNLVSVLTNSGNANFGAPLTIAVGVHPSDIGAADFDGNGSLELVVANRDSNNVSVLANGTSGGTSTFCTTAPNSAGFGTRIDSRGSVSIAANGFTLLARCAPSGSTGLFFFGTSTQFAAFGDGHRCVGGSLVRLGPPMTADATGHAVRAVDFRSAAGSAIPAGSTRHFQYWHRDVAAGGSQFNLSDALSATFRP
jgi:hypothetical protein